MTNTDTSCVPIQGLHPSEEETFMVNVSYKALTEMRWSSPWNISALPHQLPPPYCCIVTGEARSLTHNAKFTSPSLHEGPLDCPLDFNICSVSCSTELKS